MVRLLDGTIAIEQNCAYTEKVIRVDHHIEVERPPASSPEENELRASRRRIALAADAERRATERAFHDGIQQRLVGLAANLELVSASVDSDPTAARSLLDELRRDAATAMEDARALAQRIYPPQLETGGLRAALRVLGVQRGTRTWIDVDPALTCPEAIEAAAYFCCLELLDRTDPAGDAHVAVHGDGDRLTLEVTGDRDLTAGTSLEDRVASLGGDVTVTRGSEGTRVTCSLPLAP